MTRHRTAAALAALAFLFGCPAPTLLGADSNSWIAYVGTYSRRTSQGIYAFRFDGGTGKLTPLGLAAEAKFPSFLAVSADNRFLYSTNEWTKTSGGEGPGGFGRVSAYAIEPGGHSLRFLGSQSSGGEGPAHVCVDRGNHWLYVANYNSGSVGVFPLGSDGSPGPLKMLIPGEPSDIKNDGRRQQGPHAHCVVLDPAEKFLYSCDLGADRVNIYRVGGPGQIERADPAFATIPRGNGARHILLSPKTHRAYVVSEMGSTVSVFTWDEKAGRLPGLLQILSTLPADWKGTSTAAEIQMSPDGRFLYVSNRGLNSIARFAIAADGTLTLDDNTPSGGKTPRYFTFDPTSRFVIVGDEDSELIQVFRFDAKTGGLELIPGDTGGVSMPGCIVFVPE